MPKKKKSKNLKKQIYTIIKLQKFLYKAAGKVIFIYYISLIFQAILPILSMFLYARLIDAIVYGISVHQIVPDIYKYLISILGLSFVSRMFGNGGVIPSYLLQYIDLRMDKYLQLYRIKHYSLTRIEILERSKIADKLQLLQKNAGPRTFYNTFRSIYDSIVDIINILASAFIVAIKFPFLSIVLFISIFPAVIIAYIEQKEQHNFWDAIINTIRRVNRSWWQIMSYVNILKSKLLGMLEYIVAKYGDSWYISDESLIERYNYWSFKIETLSHTVILLGKAIIYYELIRLAILGQITVGQITYYEGLFSSVRDRIINFGSRFGRLSKDLYYLGIFFDFYEKTLPHERNVLRKTKKPVRVRTLKGKDINVKNLKFKYPDSERYALTSIDLYIPYGANVAIVGHNGAGKSTFMKILQGHYINYEGSLKVGKHEVYEYDYNSYFSRFSTLPQQIVKLDFATFYEAVRLDYERRKVKIKNWDISLFDIAKLFKTRTEFKRFVNDIYSGKYKDAWQEYFLKKQVHKVDNSVIEVLKQVGLYEDVKQMPHGIFTYLSPDYGKDGTDLSMGQWQRLHIARILYAPGDILILDEPTSAIDPMASFKLIDTIFDTFKDRTVIIVSHRYSTIAKADLIYVFDKGRVVESGTHKQLIAKNGVYTKAYKEEMKRLGA